MVQILKNTSLKIHQISTENYKLIRYFYTALVVPTLSDINKYDRP